MEVEGKYQWCHFSLSCSCWRSSPWLFCLCVSGGSSPIREGLPLPEAWHMTPVQVSRTQDLCFKESGLGWILSYCHLNILSKFWNRGLAFSFWFGLKNYVTGPDQRAFILWHIPVLYTSAGMFSPCFSKRWTTRRWWLGQLPAVGRMRG